ncbi:MAG TPA: hypothetical protein VK550_26540 [Polyangiaceae bacterium]|nr:hypothetical protein [Polyangiaceae bacterium]
MPPTTTRRPRERLARVALFLMAVIAVSCARSSLTADWVTHALDAGKHGWSLQSIDNVPEVLASPDTGDVLSALRTCTGDGVLSIVGDETLARRAIKEAWLSTTPERRVTVSRP